MPRRCDSASSASISNRLHRRGSELRLRVRRRHRRRFASRTACLHLSRRSRRTVALCSTHARRRHEPFCERPAAVPACDQYAILANERSNTRQPNRAVNTLSSRSERRATRSSPFARPPGNPREASARRRAAPPSRAIDTQPSRSERRATRGSPIARPPPHRASPMPPSRSERRSDARQPEARGHHAILAQRAHCEDRQEA